jgi:hypothetical protein
MEINCDKLSEKYLLTQNPLYAFSFPISVLVAIIIFGCAKAYKWSDNSYINQILIPLLSLLLTMVLLDVISRMMLSKKDTIFLSQLCKQWLHDPNVNKKHLLNGINMDIISKYKVEGFTTDNTLKKILDDINEPPSIHSSNNSNNVNIPIAQIKNMSPFPLESEKDGSLCIENSNSCNLCSGSGKNPYNIISPIPGPQWMPQNAESVQNRLVNNNYTQSSCKITK